MSPASHRELSAALASPPEHVLRAFTPEDAQRARLLHLMGFLLSASGLLFAALQMVSWLHPAYAAPVWTDLMLEAFVLVAGPLTLVFVRTGRLQAAAWTVLSLLLVGSAVQLFVEGRPMTDTAGRPTLLVTVVVAFVLLERPAAWYVLAGAAAIIIGVHVLWWGGYLPPPKARDPLNQLIFSITAWVVLATILGGILYSTMGALRFQTRAQRQRLRELTVLHQVGRRITRELDVESLLETAVQSIHDAFSYDSVVIATLDEREGTLEAAAMAGQLAAIIPRGRTQKVGEGLIGHAARRVETVLVNDVATDQRYLNRHPERIHTQSELCVPIRIGDTLSGVLDVQSDDRDAFDDNDRMVLETLAAQIAVAMENARLYEAERAAHQRVRDLVTYLQNAQELERTHIAREILDEFAQLMTALQVDLSWLTRKLPTGDPALAEKTEGMSSVIDASLQVVRRLSSQLRPSVLDHFGLAPAVRWHAESVSERSGIPHHFRVSGPADDLDPELSTALFRILQETLIRIERQAAATEVSIELLVEPDLARLVVMSDGLSMVTEETSGPPSLGLAGTRQRARALGGDVIVERISGGGSRLLATIPQKRSDSPV